MTKSQCEAIEKDYNFYTREKSIGKRTHSKRNIVTEKQTIVVDYDEEKMYSPHEGSIKRQFQKGLWLQVRDSDHQRQIHAKINRVQIDNQLTNCWFPVGKNHICLKNEGPVRAEIFNFTKKKTFLISRKKRFFFS